MKNQNTIARMALLLSLCPAISLAQNKPIEPAARRQIDSGNQAWIDGMKQGDVQRIAVTYTLDAVDCSPEGECVRGRSAIAERMKTDLARLGKAEAASVTSVGSVQQGHFVYEWGQAEARFHDGKKIVDRYLTTWRAEPDGTWRIFRNLVIPNK